MIKQSNLRPLFLVAALVVVGCSPMPLPSAGVPGTGPTPPVVGAEIAGPGTILQPLPTGVLLLTEPKDGKGFERNLAVCKAFFRTLPSTAEVRAEAPVAPNLIATRWLSSRQTVGSRDCTRLVNEYDYARAAVLLRRIGASNVKGPFFVGYLGNSWVAVNGSSYADNDLDAFVGNWARTILKANEDYARLDLTGDMPATPPRQTPFDKPVREASGIELLLIGVLKTAAELLYPIAVITTGLAGR
ncbi:MAG: hypothetical protein Q8J92_01560 [Parvibaculum sp.]|nr:hypothetical protein [Parvibaculum sp.]